MWAKTKAHIHTHKHTRIFCQLASYVNRFSMLYRTLMYPGRNKSSPLILARCILHGMSSWYRYYSCLKPARSSIIVPLTIPQVLHISNPCTNVFPVVFNDVVPAYTLAIVFLFLGQVNNRAFPQWTRRVLVHSHPVGQHHHHGIVCSWRCISSFLPCRRRTLFGRGVGFLMGIVFLRHRPLTSLPCNRWDTAMYGSPAQARMIRVP